MSADPMDLERECNELAAKVAILSDALRWYSTHSDCQRWHQMHVAAEALAMPRPESLSRLRREHIRQARQVVEAFFDERPGIEGRDALQEELLLQLEALAECAE
jgi:hypothetical protein